jgi:hypothetical protein
MGYLRFLFGDKRFHLVGVFIRDGQNYQSFVFKLLIESFQIRHFLAAGWAPCSPKVQEHNLVAQILQSPWSAVQIPETEIRRCPRLVVGFQLLQGPRKPWILQ